MNRPEARSLLLKDLSASQRKAVEDISRSLLSALTELEQIKKEEGSTSGVPSGDPKVDRHRTSRIFFVSGEPGSGKSTVYVTLWETLKNPEREDHEDCPTLKRLRRNPEQCQQIRWLEPLDLEPAADSTNFLAAILVRIDQAVHGSSREAPERSRRPGLLEPNADPRQELQRLQNDVVLAWDGNVPQRAAHVDPDIYSVEVLRAERARLSVNDRLRRTLNSLVQQDGLFVLPVDDFYLKPTSSLQFLRLLRMISVPRLFILVLGDLDVIEELFYQDMLGQLVRLAGEPTLQAITQQERALTGRANALTAHAIRKLIPMGQRSYLETMSKLQALDFSPEQLGVQPSEALSFAGKGAGEVTLRALLKDIGLAFQFTLPWPSQDAEQKPGHTAEQETAVPQAQSTKPSNLYDFLALRSEDKEKKGPLYTYSGLEVLDLPPREVVDLWSQLAGIVRKRGGEKELLEVVIEQASEALSAQSYISWAALERFREAIQGRRYFERTFVTSVLEVTPEAESLPLPEGKGLNVSKHVSWTFRPRSKPDGKHELPEDAINYLAPRPRAWFTVLYDLMALSKGNHLDGPPLVPKPFELPWVSVSAGQAGEKPICWPTPAWPSFWHFDRLGFYWNKVVGSLSKKLAEETTDPEKLVDWLAYNWIRCITRILLLDGKDLKEEPPDLAKVPDWDDLVRETASLWAYDLARNWFDDLGKSTVPDRVKGRFKKP